MICAACGATSTEGSAFCRSCGQPIVGYSVGGSSAGSVAGPPPAGVYVAPAGGVVGARAASYAGFWLRFVAAFIDGLVLLIPFGIFGILVFASVLPTLRELGAGGAPPSPMVIMPLFMSRFLVFALFSLVISWLYWAYTESSDWQGTLGKKALGLYVTDLDGRRLTFGKASGRFWAGRGLGAVPSIGGLYYLIDCIMAGFTERKQALHDMIAGCLVMRSS